MQNPTEYLRYTFTDQEIADAARDLATANRTRTSLELRKKEVDAAIKADIEAQNSIIARLSQLIGTGFEYRDIEVRIELDTPEPGKKTIIRLDTGEEVAVKAMTDREKQMSLDLQSAAEAEEERKRQEEIVRQEAAVIVTPPPVLPALPELEVVLAHVAADGTVTPLAAVTDVEDSQPPTPDGAPLAPAAVMGGTHQKKSKRGKEAAAGDEK